MINLKVICITGMPRSGTSFLVKCFKELKTINQKNLNILNEPKELSKCFNNGTDSISVFKNICNNKNSENDIIIYKHPQVILVNPIPKEFKVRYIYCIRRDFEKWKQSAIKRNIAFYLNINSNCCWIKNNWPFEWNYPKNLDDRIKIFYDLYTKKINEKIKNNESILFEFEDSKKSLNLIFKFFNIEENSNIIYKLLWRKL